MLNKSTCLGRLSLWGPSSLFRVNPKFLNFQFLPSAVTRVSGVIGVMTPGHPRRPS